MLARDLAQRTAARRGVLDDRVGTLALSPPQSS